MMTKYNRVTTRQIVFDPILSLIRTTHIDAQQAGTISKEYFGEAKVVYIGSNFQDQFLGLKVEATKTTELAVHNLENDSLDVPIRIKLGNNAEISASHLKAFLAHNRESPECFIFYLRGKEGNLWAVDANWYDDKDGWFVYARSVEDACRWNAGHKVVSLFTRN